MKTIRYFFTVISWLTEIFVCHTNLDYDTVYLYIYNIYIYTLYIYTLYIYIYIYIIYIFIYTSSGFLQQDLRRSYSFGKIRRTVVYPIVFNTCLIFLISYICHIYSRCTFLFARDAFLNDFSIKPAVFLSAIK